MLVEAVGQGERADLVPAGPRAVDAADHVQRSERDHEARHAGDGDDRAVDDPAGHADAEPGEHDDQDRDVRMPLEEQAGGVGGQAEHGADREVDVARDDHHRLADREQADDRRAADDLLQVRRAHEVRVVDRGHEDDERERQHDPELAEAEHELGERVRARAPRAPGAAAGAAPRA